MPALRVQIAQVSANILEDIQTGSLLKREKKLHKLVTAAHVPKNTLRADGLHSASISPRTDRPKFGVVLAGTIGCTEPAVQPEAKIMMMIRCGVRLVRETIMFESFCACSKLPWE